MIRLSANVLDAAVVLLKRLERHEYTSVDDLCYTTLSRIDPSEIWRLALKCDWVFEEHFRPKLTRKGCKILELESQNQYEERMKEMLLDYVLRIKPIWANRIPAGRREATIFMTKDEQVCFMEAGLLEEMPSPRVVAWWDKITENIRSQQDEINTNVGRLGERCTIEYEKKRVGVTPKWISINSNLAGYDIKSQDSFSDDTPVFIEVKASIAHWDDAFFYITANEWNTAKVSKGYIFYLWYFENNKRMLATIRPDKMQEYIPINNMTGEWISTRIPFNSFKEDFFEVASGEV